MIVVWRVTEHCNLACPFCAYDRGLARSRREADPQLFDSIGRMLGEHRRSTGERVLVSWLGGEPFLWKPIFEVSSHLRQQYGLDISATTNGSTLHLRHVFAQVLSDFSELTVSVDGPADFHDRTRGQPGLWTRLRDALSSLAEMRCAGPERLKLRANVVLMRSNLAFFGDLCRSLADWGLDEITFNQLGGRDRPEFFPAHRLRPQDAIELAALLPDLQTELAARGVRLCGTPRYVDRIIASAEGRLLSVADCSPGEQYLFVDQNGLVAPCSFTTGDFGVQFDDKTIGNVFTLRNGFIAAARQKRSVECDDCQSTRVFAKFGG